MQWIKRLAPIMLGLLFLILFFRDYLPWKGEVVRVIEGDIIEVMHEGKVELIRLYGIDTPELRQDFGQRAREFTESLALARLVEVIPAGADNRGRAVGHVFRGEVSLSRELVKAGLAWVYLCEGRACPEWRELENQARKQRLGLWSVSDHTPPWEFRKEVSGEGVPEK